MSAFYDLASLVLVPSGYKASKVYAQKPLTTDGQLTFSRASTATRVNSAGLIEEVASNVPRLDYLGSSCPRLLLEPQRTNIALYSEQFDNAVYLKTNNTITANATTSPDGNTNADKVIPTATSGFHSVDILPSVIVTTYTLSVFAKAGEYSKIALLTNNRGSNMARGFDLDNGTTFANDFGYNEPTSFSIENYGNGWYRCSITYPKTSTGTSGNGVAVINDAGASTFAGNGTDGLFLYGFQMESGASYVSSYIPTLGAAVTRAADAASKTGISSLIGQTEGTIFGEFANPAKAAQGRYFSLSDGTGNNRIDVYALSPTSLGIYAAKAGTAIVNTSFNVPANAPFKYAIAYKAGQWAWYLNGVQVGTSTDTNVPAMGNVQVTTASDQTAKGEANPVVQALLFKTRLTNAQLAELTAL